MSSFTSNVVLTGLAVLLLAQGAHAFGAGNIGSTSTIEGVNWRHGDIEDALLAIVMARAVGGKKFDKMNVARVYFGNWLRDYSQAIDVGTVKYVSAEAIRLLLWILGFMTFGYGTKEFEVTNERLGCYRPEDHIDNPKDYADNVDARQYHRQLREPVEEAVELAIDENTGMKNYIANERAGITTSAQHVRNLFTESTMLARSYANSKDEKELHEALRLLGTGLHCLEDWPAHSNYTELALIELGEEDVFPHVGANTSIRLPGARGSKFPIVTGTFGGVDFLHSVLGEVNDKATQSEIQQLESTMQGNAKNDTSFLKELLAKIPQGVFGDTDESTKADELRDNALNAQMSQTQVSPRDKEAFTAQMEEYHKQIYPIIEWHDETMQKISKAIDSIPMLSDVVEKLEEEMSIFVFGLLAPFVLPIINQLKNELSTGSSEIIQSSKDQQLIVFNDDDCNDPTHSMLAKDHFSNILNEPAGKIASATVKWVVPQLMEAWDDESVDIDRVCTRIINGVLHHPAHRDQGEDGAQEGRQMMFAVVEEWWNAQHNQQELRQKLSREGVRNGENHKEGQQDCGHGCGKNISMAKSSKGQGALGGFLGKGQGGRQQQQIQDHVEQAASKAAGGGALGGIVGGIAGALSGGLLSGAFGQDEKKSKKQDYETADGGRTQKYSEYGSNADNYGQASYQETTYPSGESRSQYNRYEETRNDDTPNTGYQERTDTHRVQGGGFETTTQYTSQYGSEVRTEEFSSRRGEGGEEHTSPRSSKKFHSNKQYGKNDSNDDDDDDDNDDDDEEKKERKRLKKEKKRRQKEEREMAERQERRGSVGGGYDAGYQQSRAYADRTQQSSYGGSYGGSGGYGEQREERQESYGGGGGYGGGRNEESSYGRGNDDAPTFSQPSYGGRQEEPSHGGHSGYGGGRQEESYGGRQQEYGSGGMPGGFGGEERGSGYGDGRQGDSYGRQQEYGGNSSYGHREEQSYEDGRQQYGGGEERGGHRRKKSNDSNDDDYNRRRNRSGSRERRY